MNDYELSGMFDEIIAESWKLTNEDPAVIEAKEKADAAEKAYYEILEKAHSHYVGEVLRVKVLKPSEGLDW